MNKLVLSFLICTLLSACSKDTTEQDKRTLEYFSQNLEANMDYTRIVKTFGDPDGDKGSGIHIYVYKLTDSTEIWIGFTDHIMYARQLDSNGVLLFTLI